MGLSFESGLAKAEAITKLKYTNKSERLYIWRFSFGPQTYVDIASPEFCERWVAAYSQLNPDYWEMVELKGVKSKRDSNAFMVYREGELL